MSMQVRRVLIYDLMGDKSAQRAFSLLMLLKKRLGKTSSMKDASLNKLATLAGVSPNTIKKYLVKWTEWNFVEWQGRKKDIFVIKSLSSSTKHRNLDVHRLDFKSFKGLYNSLKSLLFLIVNSRKEFIRRTIRVATNPRKGEDFNHSRKLCKSYVKMKKGDERYIYHENGLSYKKIGEFLGFCKRSAEKIVKYAVDKRWCRKFTHFEWTSMPGVNRMYVEGYTFTTMNYAFNVMANTYKNSRGWDMVLIGGKK